MSIGVWDPSGDKGQDRNLDSETLARFLAAAHALGDGVTPDGVAASDIAGENWIMSLEGGNWDAAGELASADIEMLIRFFTLVERQVSGWDAGNRSPVIPLVRILKSRNAFEPDFRKWIKRNTDNRYLPHGSAL